MSDDSSKSVKVHQPNTFFAYNLGHPVFIILITLGAFFVSIALAGIFVEIGAALVLDHRPTQLVTQYSSSAQFLYILLAEAMVIMTVLSILDIKKLPLAAIGLGRKIKLKDIGFGLAGYGIFFVAVFLVIVALTALIPGFDANQNQDVGFNNISTSSDRWLAFASLVIIPPIAEEILMRGYLYSGLRRYLKFVPAMLITSLMFGAAHLLTGESGLLWSAAVSTFVLSIVLVYLRERTGALYAGIAVHMLNNFIAFGVHFHAGMF